MPPTLDTCLLAQKLSREVSLIALCLIAPVLAHALVGNGACGWPWVRACDNEDMEPTGSGSNA